MVAGDLYTGGRRGLMSGRLPWVLLDAELALGIDLVAVEQVFRGV